MIYSVKKIDDNIFKTTIDNIGREVVNYHTGKTDRVLVEPNSQLNGGQIYCKSDSWIKRGDIIKLSGNWYVVNHLSNLASDVYNAGMITMCDVVLTMKIGYFVYEIPAVASKYSGNSNVRGIIDDSVEGKLSFITGYDKLFDKLTTNPCVNVFGKVWQIGDYLNVNNVMTVYCQGASSTINPELCIKPIPLEFKLGDTLDLDIHVLNYGPNELPDDIEIKLAGQDMGDVSGHTVTFTKTGITSIALSSKLLGAYYVTPDIKITY